MIWCKFPFSPFGGIGCRTGRLVLMSSPFNFDSGCTRKPRKLSVDSLGRGVVEDELEWDVGLGVGVGQDDCGCCGCCGGDANISFFIKMRFKVSSTAAFFRSRSWRTKVTGAGLCKCQNPSTSMLSSTFLHFPAALRIIFKENRPGLDAAGRQESGARSWE